MGFKISTIINHVSRHQDLAVNYNTTYDEETGSLLMKLAVNKVC